MRRLVARRALLTAAALTTLVAVTAITATALVLSAAGRGSVGAALDRSAPSERVVDVSGELDVPDPAEIDDATGTADDLVRDLLVGVLAPTLDGDETGDDGTGDDGSDDAGAGAVTRRVVSSSYVVPGPSPGARTRLAVVGGYEGLEDNAVLVEGRWPSPVGPTDDGVVEVVVHERSAAALGLATGDEVTLTNSLDDSRITVRLTGTIRPEGVGSGYWAGDPLGLTGVDRGSSFVTFGPFLAGSGVESVVADPSLTWRADPALSGLTPRQVDALRGALAGLLAEDSTATARAAAALRGELDGERAGGATGASAGGSSDALSIETDLDEVLTEVASPVAVARSAVGLALALVVLLGATAALLVARLVQEDRRADAGLRASRGFSPGQLRAGNALEALVLVLPAVVLGPLLAWLAVRAVAAGTGAGSGTGAVVASVSLGPGAWAVAAVSGLAVVALLTRRGADPTGRGRIAATWSRAGLDLVAVPLAVVATLQLLALDEAALAERSEEALSGVGVDPVLALTVPMVVLAAALLLGRLLRGVLVLGAAAAARTRGTVAALAAWQLARRVDEHRAMLVSSVLAAAVVTVALAQSATFADSLEAQARFAVGSDIRVSGVTDQALAEELVARVDELGGSAVVVARERTALGDLPVELLALDGAGAGGVAAAVLAPAGGDRSWTALLRPPSEEGAVGRAPLPALVAEAVAARAGDAGRARLRVAGVDVDVTVTGRVEGVPGVGPDADALGVGPGSGRAGAGVGLLVDRAALERAVGPGLAAGTETEVWAAVPKDAVAPLRADLEERDDLTVADRWSATADRQDGPIGSGVRVALALAVLVAAVLGTVGFVAAAAVGLRRRRAEVAALRATGLSRRQVARALSVERVGLLALALLLGTGVGALTSWALSPRLVLTETATVPVPAPRAALDLVTAGSVGVVLVAVAVVSTAALWVFVARLAARPMSAELRAGEDT